MSIERAFIAIGYSKPEAMVISFLFEHDNSMVGDILEGTRLSRGTVYRALGSLINQGYVSKTDTKPVVYSLTPRVSMDLKSQLDEFYRKVSARVKPVKIVETHVLLKRIGTIFEKNGYAIRDIPTRTIERVHTFRVRPRMRVPELLDRIAEGEYCFGTTIIDRKKKLEYPRGLPLGPFINSDLHRTSKFFNCIATFVFIHTDRKDYQKLYRELTEPQPQRMRRMLFEAPENYGIEKNEIFCFRTDENLDERITSVLQEIHQRRIVVNSVSRSLKEKISQIQELILLSQEHARKIDGLLITKSPFDPSMVGKAFDEISDPLQRIKNRETRNIAIFRRKFSEEEVRINQYLDAIERRVYLPELATLERDVTGLDEILEKFKPIEYELNDCYSTLFRYGVDIIESTKTKTQAAINPFVFTEPYEKEVFFVDQELLERAALSLCRSIYEGLPNFFQIVIGQAGVGKTHAAKYIYSPIMARHKIKVLYLDCPVNYDLVSGIFQELTQESLYPGNLAAAIRELRRTAPSTTRELLHVIEEITNLWKNQKYRGLLLILDELENALPYIFFAKEVPGFEPPLALKQLHEIISQNAIDNLGFLLCCRSRIYPMLEEALKVKNIKDFTFEPQILEPRHIKELIEHRYKMWSITHGPEFETDVLDEVIKLTQGNTRDTIKYCRELFKFAIKNNIDTIKKMTLKKIGSIPLFRY